MITNLRYVGRGSLGGASWQACPLHYPGGHRPFCCKLYMSVFKLGFLIDYFLYYSGAYRFSASIFNFCGAKLWREIKHIKKQQYLIFRTNVCKYTSLNNANGNQLLYDLASWLKKSGVILHGLGWSGKRDVLCDVFIFIFYLIISSQEDLIIIPSK